MHVLRNVLALVLKDAQGMVLAGTRIGFQPPTKNGPFVGRGAAALLAEAEEQAFAHMAHMDFPREPLFHQPAWALEQGDRPEYEGGRHLPNPDETSSVFPLRPLVEQTDEWAASRVI